MAKRKMCWRFAASCTLLMAVPSVFAKASPQQLADIGNKYTCMGAEKNGSATGVPAYTGKFLKTWPGLKNAHAYDPGPYANEKPILSITAQHIEQHKKNLTEGQIALLKKYPTTYRIPVYSSHRDFQVIGHSVCEVAKYNAQNAQMTPDGLGLSGRFGAVAFPFPTTGLEVLANIFTAPKAFSGKATVDGASVYPSGTMIWSRTKMAGLLEGKDGKPWSQSHFQDGMAYALVEFLQPARLKGLISLANIPLDTSKNEPQVWQYVPSVNRVKQIPKAGFDSPALPAGFHTMDEEAGYSGERDAYKWTVLGKKEIYIPYHNFKMNDPSLRYTDMVKPNTLNPEYLRYELHRVWVLEGNLNAGQKHVYKKRVLFVDEDTWLPIWADNYNGQGQLIRANAFTSFYAPSAASFQSGVTLFHDLVAGQYEVAGLVNERGSDGWWQFNVPLDRKTFSVDTLRTMGR